ncbi:glycosyltransferase [Alishewanella sp. d11]|uniref:glycosyltransferase n=1 Tax=Alishewanella sp. d11 TaxID=3414030 RepID=UPI003BF8EA0C
MKILFVTYFFAPYNCIGAVRTTRTAELLNEMGHDVRVISAYNQNLAPNLLSTFPESNIERTKWVDLEKPIYSILGKKSVSSLKGNLHKASFKGRFLSLLNQVYQRIISIPDKYIGWYPYAFKEANRLIDSGWFPDVIYASATPYTSCVIANALSKRFEIPWVAELRDLWSDNHYGYNSWLDQIFESKVLKRAAAIVTVSEPLKDVLSKKYPRIPVSVILNAYDENDFNLKNTKPTNKGCINIVYTGSVYAGKRDPSPLFELLCSRPDLRKITKIDFYGSNLGFIDFLIKKYDLGSCITLNSMISREEAIAKQSNSDILLLLTWNDPKEKGILTGKLFEYIGAAKPILLIGAIHDDAANIIVQNGFGFAANEPPIIGDFIDSVFANHFLFNTEKRVLYERKEQVVNLVRVFRDVIK